MIEETGATNEVVCACCKISTAEPGWETPLCTKCRTLLSKRPIPVVIKLFFVLLMTISLLMLFNFPVSLNAGIAFERAQIAARNGDYSEAVNEYKEVIKTYPNSIEVLANLALAAYKSNDVILFIDNVQLLEGREIPRELCDEINKIIEELNNKVAKDKSNLEDFETK